MSRSHKFYFYSFLVHAILFGWLFFAPKPPVASRENIAIELETRPTPVVINSKKGREKASRPSGVLSGSGNIQRYFSGYRFDQGSVSISDAEAYGLNSRRDNPMVEWGSGAATFERIEEYNLMAVLYERIDGSLSYPGVLARNKIRGTVNARVVFDEGQKCDWKFTRIRGQEAYLQLYVLDLLKRVCAQNFKQYLGDRQITNVDLSFQFDINENNEADRVAQQKFIVGNTLLFYRNSHQSIAEWELGPFKGIFPVPAVYLNIQWIQENWDRLVHKKDPLKEFKRQFGEG